MAEIEQGRELPVAAGARTGSESVAAALGGRMGVVESSLPIVTFVTAYTATGHDARLAAAIALAAGVALAAVRLGRRQTPRYALAGLGGVALAAFVVSRTGRAEDFFLPGLLLNAAYALAYLGSIAIRWPLLGVIVGLATGHGTAWRRDPLMLRAYTRASWIWVGLFSLRLAVQLPLYFAGATLALGVARVAMGVPLFALAAWLSWLMLRPRPA